MRNLRSLKISWNLLSEIIPDPRTLRRSDRQMVNQTVTNWDAYTAPRCVFFPFCSDWRPQWLICAVFPPFPSSALMGFKDLGLVLDDQWINKLFSKDKSIASFGCCCFFGHTYVKVLRLTEHSYSLQKIRTIPLCTCNVEMILLWRSMLILICLCGF